MGGSAVCPPETAVPGGPRTAIANRCAWGERWTRLPRVAQASERVYIGGGGTETWTKKRRALEAYEVSQGTSTVWLEAAWYSSSILSTCVSRARVGLNFARTLPRALPPAIFDRDTKACTLLRGRCCGSRSWRVVCSSPGGTSAPMRCEKKCPRCQAVRASSTIVMLAVLYTVLQCVPSRDRVSCVSPL